MIYRSMVTGGLAAFLALAGPAVTKAESAPPAPPRPTSNQPKPSASAGTSSTTMTVSGCTFTVTYTWSGFKGRDLIATFGVYQRGGTMDISVVLQNTPGQDGKGGSVSHTFTLPPGPVASRMLLGRGSLVNGRNYQQISGTVSGSSSVPSSCG